MTAHEDDFASLVWLSRGKVFLYRISVQNVLPCVKASCPLAKNVHETLEINKLTLYPGVGENGFQK